MKSHEVDIVMTDHAMRPLGGLDFVRLIRRSPESPNPMCPVIMITGHSTLQRVHEALNAGVNEFLTKPLTARGVIERLVQVIDHPRPFVRTDDYFGPDRRRRADRSHPGPWRRADDRSEQDPAVHEL
jgi:DNA-binding NtrC family response regulator